MDSPNEEQLFDAIRMSILLGYSNTARYVFNDALKLIREDIIDECIDLALKRNAFFLIVDLEKMKQDKLNGK